MRARTFLLTASLALAALALPTASAEDPTEAAACLADSVGGTAYPTLACLDIHFSYADCVQGGTWFQLRVGPVTLVDQRCDPPDS